MSKEAITHQTPLSYQEIMTATLPPTLAPARDAAIINQFPIKVLWQEVKPFSLENFWHTLAFGGSEALAKIIAKAQKRECYEVMPLVDHFKQTRALIEKFQTKFPGLIPPIFSEILVENKDPDKLNHRLHQSTPDKTT